jgi:hypothetical protein
LNRHFCPTASNFAATLLASSVLMIALSGPRAQAQTQIDSLRQDVSYLNSRVCGLARPDDPAARKVYDDQKQALADAAAALIAALNQQEAKLTGNDVDTTLKKNSIENEKTALGQPCPGLPAEVRAALNATAPVAGAAPAPKESPTPLPQQVTVTAPGDFGTQTIGTRSDPKTVTVTNSSGSTQPLDLFVWYGTHLTNFKVTANTCDTYVPDKGSCTFNVSFAPLTRGPAEERLRVVSRSDWEKFENVRRAYEEQGGIPVDEAARKVNEQRNTPAASTLSAILFCGPNKVAGDPYASACNDLNMAQEKMTELQQKIDAKERKTAKDVDDAANHLRDLAMAVIPLTGTGNHWTYPLTRAVVGEDLSAVSSQTVRQAYFVDFNLLAPFKFPGFKTNEDALESRWWFWLNPRITSLPKAADPSAISTIDESGTFFTNFSNQHNTTDIAQGFDVNGGLEMALIKPRNGIPWWGEYVNTQARLGISVIAGAGVATPFSSPDTDVTLQVNQSICDAFKAPPGATVSTTAGLVCTTSPGTPPQAQLIVPDPNDPTKVVNNQFISFFTPERSRFFRRYYGGLRLKTYFFSPDVRGDCNPKQKYRCDAPYDIFPGIVDVTVGKDEAVTAGRLKHVLFRVEGVYPLPFVPGLHVFGSIYSSFRGNSQGPPFNTFTITPPAAGAANDANTFRFPLNPLDRDYFRIGVGVDLIQLLKHNKGGQPTKDTSTTSSQSGNSGSSTTPPSGSGGSSTTP